ncbi:MAG: hypothetical protein MUE46_09785 [Xanthomonadales bacterium]|jgi:uncharacterized coiled-coil protein SlyX|nr:hypothetical protein [Xanthomonadales bacterium]
MTMVLWVGLAGAALIGFATAWYYARERRAPLVQSLNLRLKLRERDLRLAEERLRRLESDRWRPLPTEVSDGAAAESLLEIDADGLPKRPVPAAVQAELMGLEHRCALQRIELDQLRRELASSAGECRRLRAEVDALLRRGETGEQGEPGG